MNLEVWHLYGKLHIQEKWLKTTIGCPSHLAYLEYRPSDRSDTLSTISVTTRSISCFKQSFTILGSLSTECRYSKIMGNSSLCFPLSDRFKGKIPPRSWGRTLWSASFGGVPRISRTWDSWACCSSRSSARLITLICSLRVVVSCGISRGSVDTLKRALLIIRYYIPKYVYIISDWENLRRGFATHVLPVEI